MSVATLVLPTAQDTTEEHGTSSKASVILWCNRYHFSSILGDPPPMLADWGWEFADYAQLVSRSLCRILGSCELLAAEAELVEGRIGNI
jgi:hypothetical protein